jgi:hypothetical protein
MPDVTSPFAFPYPEDTDLVRDGAQDIENLATGVNDYLAGGYLYAGTIYYTSSGSFVKADPLGGGDIGLRAVRVRLVGAGGGGGGAAITGASQNAFGGGGGGGAYGEIFIDDMSTLGTTETVTRGGGGAGGAAGANAGTAGGSSSFGSLLTALAGNGGGGGPADTVITSFYVGSPGAGGAAGSGDFVIAGSAGTNGQRAQAAFGFSTVGGPSHLSGRLFVSSISTGATGLAGLPHGGGGSGGSNIENQVTARSGGAGANGIVIVDCFV